MMYRFLTLLFVLALTGSQPAMARGFGRGGGHIGSSHGVGHFGHHRGHVGFYGGIGFGFGFYDWWPGYYGPYYYGEGSVPMPYSIAVPSYYYCADPAGYYPMVASCSQPWQAVPIPPQ